MKKLISATIVLALSAATCLVAQDKAQAIGGNWHLSLETPHGAMQGDLHLKQEGSKITGTCETDHTGVLQVTGAMEGKKVSLRIQVHEDQAITFMGEVEGDKMSGGTEPDTGKWTATRTSASAQSTPQKTISGTVTEFKAEALEIGVRPDHGDALRIKVGPETQVVQVPPGERDLETAKPAKVTDLAVGDRILVSFVTGLTEARRIVWISATDIAGRNEAERQDWKTRGISGIVTSRNGNEISLELRTSQGVQTATVTVAGKTKIRRYAPDSVKFTDATECGAGDIAVGDLLQARGEKTGDGSNLRAEDIVFGTFLTKLGPITAVNRDRNEIQIQDLATKKLLTIKLTAGSRLKTMSAMRAVAGARDHAMTRSDLQQIMEQLPPAKIEDLKVGGGVVVTSTRGTRSDEVTAIMLLANADVLVQIAQGGSEHGEGGMDAIGRSHGGMLAGPSGLSLPAMLQ